jgi:hypothetical protein
MNWSTRNRVAVKRAEGGRMKDRDSSNDYEHDRAGPSPRGVKILLLQPLVGVFGAMVPLSTQRRKAESTAKIRMSCASDQDPGREGIKPAEDAGRSGCGGGGYRCGEDGGESGEVKCLGRRSRGADGIARVDGLAKALQGHAPAR